jgi:calcineurin-like phosphoesterase family protein
MTIFFSSDFHAFHANIAGPNISRWSSGYRDFDSIEDMNEAIAKSVNDVIMPNDTLYYLGDWSFGRKENIEKFRAMLAVRNIHFILGNHDRNIMEFHHLFSSVKSYDEIRVEGQHICLFHFPIASFHKEHRGAWHLCGHSHYQFTGSQADYLDKKILDVGWCHFRKPLSFAEIKKIMDRKRFTPVDAHGA